MKVDMNWVPSIHPAAVESEDIQLPPPPINREQKYSESTIHIQTESDALVPALPPKPNNWSVNSNWA